MEKFLNKNYDLKRNLVTNKIMFRKKGDENYKILDSIQLNTLVIKLQKKVHNVTQNSLDMYLYSNYVESYDPFKEYFENLPDWDKSTDYIQQLAKTVNTSNNEYFAWCLKKWLVALVACSYNEDITNQSALIFSGEQGAGKTTWVRSLIPKDLKEYLYEGNIIQNDKDTKFHLADKLIIFMDEITSIDKSKNEFYKGLISLDYIEQRRPYTRQSIRMMRRASFVGSTNNIEILTDLTGNRRYLCIEALSFVFNSSVDIDKVYSQAMHLYKNGFQFFFDKDEIKKIEEENKIFLRTPEEYDLIEMLFEHPSEKSNNVLMSASEVLEHIKLNGRLHKNASVEQVGKALVSLGYKKRTRQKKYELKLKNTVLNVA